MRVRLFLDALRADLATLAGVGDAEVRGAAERLSAALDSAVTVRLLELFAQLAVDLTEQLGGQRVEVRLVGGEPELVIVTDEPSGEVDDDDEQSARVSLRLPPSLKERIDAAADLDGVSTNTWIVRSLSRATTTTRTISTGRRLRGYGRS